MPLKNDMDKILKKIDGIICTNGDAIIDNVDGYTTKELRGLTGLGEHRLNDWLAVLKQKGQLTISTQQGTDILGRSARLYRYKIQNNIIENFKKQKINKQTKEDIEKINNCISDSIKKTRKKKLTREEIISISTCTISDTNRWIDMNVKNNKLEKTKKKYTDLIGRPCVVNVFCIK